jgi:NifU-like protein involved in Fe-S cluster formation
VTHAPSSTGREPPYTFAILRLAASLPIDTDLPDATGHGEARSSTCGSTLRTAVCLADDRICALTQKVTACAYGQASAALVQQWAVGRTGVEVVAMKRRLARWLSGAGEVPADFEPLAPVQGRAGRHGAVLLPFDALLAAMTTGGER